MNGDAKSSPRYKDVAICVKPKRQVDNDYDEFINFCQAIHTNEAAPELMAQDYKGSLSVV